MLTKFANGHWFRLADVKTVISETIESSGNGIQHYASVGLVPVAYFPTRQEADAERDRIAALVNQAEQSASEVNHDPILDIQRAVAKSLRENEVVQVHKIISDAIVDALPDFFRQPLTAAPNESEQSATEK